jgi:hypothetical protein
MMLALHPSNGQSNTCGNGHSVAGDPFGICKTPPSTPTQQGANAAAGSQTFAGRKSSKRAGLKPASNWQSNKPGRV